MKCNHCYTNWKQPSTSNVFNVCFPFTFGAITSRPHHYNNDSQCTILHTTSQARVICTYHYIAMAAAHNSFFRSSIYSTYKIWICKHQNLFWFASFFPFYPSSLVRELCYTSRKFMSEEAKSFGLVRYVLLRISCQTLSRGL